MAEKYNLGPRGPMAHERELFLQALQDEARYGGMIDATAQLAPQAMTHALTKGLPGVIRAAAQIPGRSERAREQDEKAFGPRYEGGLVELGKMSPKTRERWFKLISNIFSLRRNSEPWSADALDIRQVPAIRFQKEAGGIPISRGERGQTYFKLRSELPKPNEHLPYQQVSIDSTLEGGPHMATTTPSFPGTTIAFLHSGSMKAMLGDKRASRPADEFKSMPGRKSILDFHDSWKLYDHILGHQLNKSGVSRVLRPMAGDYVEVGPGDRSIVPALQTMSKQLKHAQKQVKKGGELTPGARALLEAFGSKNPGRIAPLKTHSKKAGR